MTKWFRPSIVASILAGVVCGIGCSPMTMLSFLGPEASKPAELQALTIPDKDKKDKNDPIKVAIVTFNGYEDREEFINADRQLNDLLIRHLKDLATFNEQKIEFVNLRKILDYTSSHPHWQEDLDQVGKDLKADFVIYLEINKLTMYDPGTSRQLYKGRADISVTLYRVGDVDNLPQQKHYSGVYPSVREFVQVDADTPPGLFREQFMNYIAKHISWYFMAHPTKETYMDDDDDDKPHM